jgi:hypothetical protein
MAILKYIRIFIVNTGISISKTKLLKEIIAVDLENHTKYLNTLHDQRHSF